MSYDFKLKFLPSQKLFLIDALRESDPNLDVSDMSGDRSPLTVGPRSNWFKQLFDKALMLVFRMWVGNVIELTSTSTPIQISVCDSSAGLHVSFVENHAAARAALAEAWKYLLVMQEVSQCQIFDRQLKRLVNLEQDFEVCFHEYNSVTQQAVAGFHEFER